jgi:cell wall-associated protease
MIFNEPIHAQIPSFVTFRGKQYAQINNEWKAYNPTTQTFSKICDKDITIKFKEFITTEQREDIETKYGLVFERSTKTGWRDYHFTTGSLLPIAIAIAENYLVKNIAFNYEGHTSSSIPDDPQYINQNYLQKIKHDLVLSDPTINLQNKNCKVLVAVIDNGVNINAIDLNKYAVAGKPGVSPSQLNENLPEDDWTSKLNPSMGNQTENNVYPQNLITDDYKGVNVFYNTNDPFYKNPTSNSAKFTHGIPMSHIIAAKANNSTDVTGIAGGWTYEDESGVSGNTTAEILPINIFEDTEETFESKYLKYALEYARLMGAKVVNMSIGIEGQVDPNLYPDIEEELERCFNQNMFLVGSSGNKNQLVFWNNTIDYPAHSKYVFSVGASTSIDGKWVKSKYLKGESVHGPLPYNYYAEGLDVIAPGGDAWITSIDDNGNVYNADGTSAASAVVSGIAANMFCIMPCINNYVMANILRETADKVQANSGAYYTNLTNSSSGQSTSGYGFGRVNEYAALKACQDWAIDIDYPYYNPDLYIKDCKDDEGYVGIKYVCNGISDKSTDIWVRNTNDGYNNQTTESLNSTGNYFIYVRINNRGCAANTDGQLKVHWSKAATNTSWPQNWNGNNSLGNLIMSIILPSIKPGESKIFEIPWNFTGPMSNLSLGPNEVCLMGRLENITNDVINPTDGSMEANNNLSLHNLVVLKTSPKPDPTKSYPYFDSGADLPVGIKIGIENPSNVTKDYNFHFQVPPNLSGLDITQDADLLVYFDEESWICFSSNNKLSIPGIEIIGDRKIRITENNITINNVTLPANTRYQIYVGSNMLAEKQQIGNYSYRIGQSIGDNIIWEGAENIVFENNFRTPFNANAGLDKLVSKNENFNIAASDINEDASYKWYDVNNNLVATGRLSSISVDSPQNIILEVIAQIDNFTSRDTMEVNIKKGSIVSISPNPTSATTNITCALDDNLTAQLILTNGLSTNVYEINSLNPSISIDFTNKNIGTYNLVLIINGIITDFKTILKN